jgi:dihydrofolate reductase
MNKHQALNLVISAIAAMSENRVIGLNNQLPWHLPADLKHFKNLTQGHPVLMGRKTYESIGRPLPNRTNLILTRHLDYTAQGCEIVSSLQAAIEIANKLSASELFIIGGAEIYQQLLSHVNKLYLTIIHHPFEGDAYFPEINSQEWQVSDEEHHEPDEKNIYPYTFMIYDKI